MTARTALRACAAAALLALVGLGLFACAPKQIDDVIDVSFRLTAGDSGAVGFSCRAPSSAACAALLKCLAENADTSVCAAQCGRDCPAAVKACPKDANPKLCAELACSSPRLASGSAADGGAPNIAVVLVVDYIVLGGIPSCLPNQLRAWCETRSAKGDPCRPIVRKCVPLDLGATSNDPVALSKQLAAQVQARGVIDPSAPNDAGVIIRAIAMAGSSCAPYDNHPEFHLRDAGDDQILGCARSCPVTLNVAQDVELDFDGTTCDPQRLLQCADFIGTAAP